MAPDLADAHELSPRARRRWIAAGLTILAVYGLVASGTLRLRTGVGEMTGGLRSFNVGWFAPEFDSVETFGQGPVCFMCDPPGVVGSVLLNNKLPTCRALEEALVAWSETEVVERGTPDGNLRCLYIAESFRGNQSQRASISLYENLRGEVSLTVVVQRKQ
jgi:hypothetical protein